MESATGTEQKRPKKQEKIPGEYSAIKLKKKNISKRKEWLRESNTEK